MRKIRYRDQILLYFSLLLLTLSLLFTYIFIQSARRSRIEQLESKMDTYSEIIYNFRDSLSSVKNLLPENLRITLIDTAGKVLFDNIARKGEELDNHIGRPEIKGAASAGSGSALRRSGTLEKYYLYFAKKYPDLYVRTALEYNSAVKPEIKKSNIYIIIAAVSFSFVILLIIILSRKISQPLVSLREFIERVQKGEVNYGDIHFPSNEFGEVGEKIIQTFSQLEETKQYKQQLTHNVAHELKTPVTSIRGYLETLLNQENIDQEQRRFFLERAYSQILRLSALVSDISLLNNIEEASGRFVSENIKLHECVKEVEDDLFYKIREKGATIHTDIDENLEIEGIYLLIYSLFRNLIENSIEHAGENIDIYIKVLSADKEYIHLTLYDNGKGVPSGHLERLFERFYRVEAGRSRSSGGSGLGLSIVRNAVTLHRGNITVRNREEGGLEFRFCLSRKYRREQVNESLFPPDV